MIILNSDRPKFCIHSLFLSRWYGVVKINWLNFRLKLTTVCNDHSLRIVFKNRKFQIYIVNNVSLILFSVLFSFSTLWIVLQRFYTAANLFGRVKSNSRLYEPYICCVVVLKPHCFPQLETKRIGFETKHRQIRYFNLRNFLLRENSRCYEMQDPGFLGPRNRIFVLARACNTRF